MAKVARADILDADKLRVIQLQAGIVEKGEFFLAGGTGLGLRLGHRRSQDIDWFTRRAFDVAELRTFLEALPEKPSGFAVHGAHTLRAYYGELETSFLLARQVEPRTDLLRVGSADIPIADLPTLATMKAAALHDRGTRRDFVDVHAICALREWSVERFIKHGSASLPLKPEQIARALVYFADAEKEPMPAGCTTPWKTIRADLTKAVERWQRSRDDRGR
jgi:hypothetical protein